MKFSVLYHFPDPAEAVVFAGRLKEYKEKHKIDIVIRKSTSLLKRQSDGTLKVVSRQLNVVGGMFPNALLEGLTYERPTPRLSDTGHPCCIGR